MKGDHGAGEGGTQCTVLWTEGQGEKGQAGGPRAGLRPHALWCLLDCSGDMVGLDTYVRGVDPPAVA